METNLVATIIAIVLLAHGAGHMLWLVSLMGMADWRQVVESWLITPRFGCYVTQIVGAIVWLTATGAFAAAAFAMFVGARWFGSAATIGAIASILGLFLFYKNPPSQPVISAFIVDVLVLLGVPAWLLANFAK
jgi:hypothetical protein